MTLKSFGNLRGNWYIQVIITYNHFHLLLQLFSEYFLFYQIFRSPQVKRCTVFTYKRGIYELTHKLLNDLRLKDLRKLGNIGKALKLPRLPAKMQILLILAKKS